MAVNDRVNPQAGWSSCIQDGTFDLCDIQLDYPHITVLLLPPIEILVKVGPQSAILRAHGKPAARARRIGEPFIKRAQPFAVERDDQDRAGISLSFVQDRGKAACGLSPAQ